jgi:hypothetical protein
MHEAIPPEKLPPEVKAFVELLHLNVVDEPIKLLPPGYKTPVWLIPVKDEATGETIGILNAYPPYNRELYAIKTIINKLGKPVTVITFREEAERVSVPKPKPKEVEEAIRKVKEEVPVKIVTAPIDWKWMRELVGKLKGWLESMEHQAEVRSPLGVYTYLKSINEFLAEARERLLAGSETLRKREEKAKPPRKILTEEQYEEIWREFSEALRKEKIDPEKYKGRFDELIDWSMPYEDNKLIVMDEARNIIIGRKLAKYFKEIPLKPISFSWKYIDWGLGSMRVDILALEDSVKAEDALSTYNAISRLLETADRMKAILRMTREVGELGG